MIALKIPIIESERGWGQRTDDYMVVLSEADAKAFIKEYNSQNTSPEVPDWYMYASSDLSPVELSDKQFKELKKKKRVYLSTLKSIK